MTPVRRPSSPLFSCSAWHENLVSSDLSDPIQAPFLDPVLEPRTPAHRTPCSHAFSSCSVRSTARVSPHPVSPSVAMPRASPPRLPCPLSTFRATFSKKPKRDVTPGTQVGRWTKREHELFLEGLQRFGKSWKKISSLVHTRTLVQIRTHAQKYLQKQSRVASRTNAPGTGGSRDVLTCLAATSALHCVPEIQDHSSVPAFMDEYYTSPTAIEDDLLGLGPPSDLWVPQLTQDTVASSYSAIVPAPSVSSTFTPVPAPDTLTSSQRPAPPNQFAAPKFEETNVWL